MHDLLEYEESFEVLLREGKQLIAWALVDDSFMFLKALLDNIAKIHGKCGVH